ncbi:hypothetical protein KAU39_01845 [bacterium]|nr:hypothetical protein [bacterium]
MNIAVYNKGNDPKLNNLIAFLQNKCNFKCKFENGNIIFEENMPNKYFEELKISDGQQSLDDKISEVKHWLINYPFEYKSCLTESQLKSIGNKIKKAENIKNKLYHIGKYLFLSSNEQIGLILKNYVIPAYSKIFPKGNIYFMKVEPILNQRLAASRTLFALDQIPEIYQNVGHRFRGIQTLKNLSESSNMLGYTGILNPIMGIFSPYLIGISKERLGGAFIFLFDKLVDCRSIFPSRLQELLRKDATYFSEHVPGEKILNDPVEKVNFNINDTESLLYEYVEGMNNLFEYFTNPINFRNQNSDIIDTEKWFLNYLSLERIANEVLLIETEHLNQYIRKTNLFGVIDKLSELIRFHSKKTTFNSSDIFKILFKSKAINEISSILSKYNQPFGNYFRNKCKKTIKEVNKSIEKGIFISQRKKGSTVSFKDRKGKDIKLDMEDFIPSFIREVRNTYHGYAINNTNILKIHDGNISNKISFLAIYIWLAMLKDPAGIFKGKILE